MFACFRTAKGMALLALAVVVGGYFVIWHQQHVFAALPFLVILACPLMHLFMHGGHGGHGHRHKTADDRGMATGRNSRQAHPSPPPSIY